MPLGGSAEDTGYIKVSAYNSLVKRRFALHSGPFEDTDLSGENVNSPNTQTDRRQSIRLPIKKALNLKMAMATSPLEVETIDMNPYGVQIETPLPVDVGGVVEIWPKDGNGNGYKDLAIKGEIRWAMQADRAYRSGISFYRQVDWPIFLSEISSSFEKDLSAPAFLETLINKFDEGMIILDQEANIIAANPCCLPFIPNDIRKNLKGLNLFELDSILNIPIRNEPLGELVNKALRGDTPLQFTSVPIKNPGGARGSETIRNYNIRLEPFTFPSGRKGLVIHTRDVTALVWLKQRKRLRDENAELRYSYLTLGQLFDNLLEDIINPLSAVVGRLDLMAMKMSAIKGRSVEGNEIEAWKSDLEDIQNILGQVSDFCRAAARRREKDGVVGLSILSLNNLITDELNALSLHSSFKNIEKRLSLSPKLPLIKADYADWANAVVALCQAAARQMVYLDHRLLSLSTSAQGNKLKITIAHNGKALRLPLENDPALAILGLLQKKYGVIVSVSGSTGSQAITLEYTMPDKKDLIHSIDSQMSDLLSVD